MIARIPPTLRRPLSSTLSRSLATHKASFKAATGRPLGGFVLPRRPSSRVLVARRTMVVVEQHKAGKADEPVRPLPSQSALSAPPPTPASADQPLLVTDSTWNRIRQLADKKGQDMSDVYLRVFVDAGGCSGFQYQFELDEEELEADDIVIAGPDGARVVVDPDSLNLLKGSTIDFVVEMIKSSFEVRDNPQSESACGCGSSFAVKNFASNPALD